MNNYCCFRATWNIKHSISKNNITCLNILKRAYSLLINNNTRSWNIVAGWSKYYLDFKIIWNMIFRLAHSTSHFQRFLFIKLQGRILKADINLFTCYYGNYWKTIKVTKKQWKLQLTNCTKKIGRNQFT